MRPPGGSKHSSRLRALRSAAPSARKLAAASAARLTSWGAQDDLHFPVITRWIISYNLGLVHLNTGQYASAFHYFSTSINLKPDFPSSYMYLGITLNRLDDFENACAAYEKAIDMEEDHLFELNYAITLFNNDEVDKARAHYAEFEKLWARLDEDTKNADQEVVEQQQALGEALRPAS